MIRAAKGRRQGAGQRGVGCSDVYQGKGVPDGKKSLAIAVKLQPADRTLTDVEIDAVGQKIVAAVVKATGATLRG